MTALANANFDSLDTKVDGWKRYEYQPSAKLACARGPNERNEFIRAEDGLECSAAVFRHGLPGRLFRAFHANDVRAVVPEIQAAPLGLGFRLLAQRIRVYRRLPQQQVGPRSLAANVDFPEPFTPPTMTNAGGSPTWLSLPGGPTTLDSHRLAASATRNDVAALHQLRDASDDLAVDDNDRRDTLPRQICHLRTHPFLEYALRFASQRAHRCCRVEHDSASARSQGRRSFRRGLLGSRPSSLGSATRCLLVILGHWLLRCALIQDTPRSV